MRDELKQRFSTANDARIHELKEEIVICKQKGQKWRHTMLASRNFGNNYSATRQSQSLMGLNKSALKSIRSTILNEDPSPSVNHADSKVIREEKLQNIKEDVEPKEEAASFAVKVTPNPLQLINIIFYALL